MLYGRVVGAVRPDAFPLSFDYSKNQLSPGNLRIRSYTPRRQAPTPAGSKSSTSRCQVQDCILLGAALGAQAPSQRQGPDEVAWAHWGTGHVSS